MPPPQRGPVFRIARKTGASHGGDCPPLQPPPVWASLSHNTKDWYISWGWFLLLEGLEAASECIPGNAIHEAVLFQHQVKVEMLCSQLAVQV